MRACYFVQSHRDPAQVVRLVATIRRSSPTAYVLVGHDCRRCELTRRDLPQSADIDLFHPPGPIERGRLSLLSPYFLAVDRLLASGVDFDWLVYLSGQDYPTRSLGRAEASLRASGADGFLRFWPAFAPDNPWGRRRQGVFRYGFQYAEAPRWAGWLLRRLRFVNRLQSSVHLHLVYGHLVGRRARRTPFGPDRTCYAGTQWTTLRRPCVEYLARVRRESPALVAYYERTICSDESLVQTLLVNARRFDLRDDDLRFADFHGSRSGSPRILTAADFERLRSGPWHFARKFDPAVDTAILDRLDEWLTVGGEAGSGA